MNARFMPMVPVVAILADKRLTLNALRVLLALYQYADKDGNCHPSRAELSQLTGLPERKVNAATAQLVQLGWVAKSGAGGRSMAARYTITPPKTLPETGTLLEEKHCPKQSPFPPETLPETVRVSHETLPKTGTLLEPETLPVSVPKPCPKRAGAIEHTKNIPEVLNPPLIPPKPAKRAKHEPPPCLPDVDAALYARWLAHRPAIGCRKPWTADAQARHVREAAKAGLSNAEAFEYAIAAQWQAFTATYYYKAEGKQNGTQNARQFKTAREIDEENAAEWYSSGLKRNAGAFIGEPAIIREQSKLGESNGTSQLQLAG